MTGSSYWNSVLTQHYSIQEEFEVLPSNLFSLPSRERWRRAGIFSKLVVAPVWLPGWRNPNHLKQNVFFSGRKQFKKVSSVHGKQSSVFASSSFYFHFFLLPTPAFLLVACCFEKSILDCSIYLLNHKIFWIIPFTIFDLFHNWNNIFVWEVSQIYLSLSFPIFQTREDRWKIALNNSCLNDDSCI